MIIKIDEILPSVKYWKDMDINSESIINNANENTMELKIGKFTKKELDEIYMKYRNKSIPSHFSRPSFAKYLIKSDKSLASLLYLLEMFSSLVKKKALEHAIKHEGIDYLVGGSRNLTIKLFLKNPDSLLIARYKSFTINRQTSLTYFSSETIINDDLRNVDVVNNIKDKIGKELAEIDKRAGVERIEEDDTPNSFNIFIRYEDKDQRVEEWDGTHWDKPVNRVILNYDSDNKIITARYGTMKRKEKAVTVLSQIFTGKEDAFKVPKAQTTLVLPKQSSEIEELADFKILKRDIRKIKLENVDIKNTPTIEITGSNLNETLDELKIKYKLDLLKNSIHSYKITFLLEVNGVNQETSIYVTEGNQIQRFEGYEPTGKLRLLLIKALSNNLK